MNLNVLHLNLLNEQERTPASKVRIKVLLPIIAGIVTAFVLTWIGFIGVQLMVATGQLASVRGEVAEYAKQAEESAAQVAQLRDVQAEADQYAYYMNGRVKRGELLKRIASAIPEGITITSLSLPEQPGQELTFPPALKRPPLQGPTQSVEQVELRLTGLARNEMEVINLMSAIKGNSFTGLVSIVENPKSGEQSSPRVHAFRQEATADANGKRDVFFDIAYDLEPREFVK